MGGGAKTGPKSKCSNALRPEHQTHKNSYKVGFLPPEEHFRITEQMSQQDLDKLIHAFIFSRIDYCNRVFTGLPKKDLSESWS